MQNLFQDLSKKGLPTKTFHKVIAKAFFINARNEICLNPTHIQNFYFHAAAAINPILVRGGGKNYPPREKRKKRKN